MKKVELAKFDNSWYRPGDRLKIVIWYFVNRLIFRTFLPYPSNIKSFILRCFGAKIGKNVIIKPNVSIKYPWFLNIGDNCWIGEGVWIDNITNVSIGENVCLSQGCYLLTGSHDYKKYTFDLLLGEIILEDGVWIGAKSIVCPGVTCKTHSVLSVGSIATQDLEAYGICQGNPATLKREREIV